MKDVRLDAPLLLVVDRADGEVALERSKRFLHLNELDVVAPQGGGIALGQIAAQEIASFAPARLPQFLAIERILERSLLRVDLDLDQSPSARPLGFGLSEFDQQVV